MELILPNHYIELEEEEMLYLEGGKYFSNSQCKNLVLALGMNPYTFASIATYATIALKVARYAKAIGGVWGFVLGAAVSYSTNQVITFSRGVARGIMYRGVDIYWNWDWFASGLGYTVHY